MPTYRERGGKVQAVVRMTVNGRKHEESQTFPSRRLAEEWATKLESRLRIDGVPSRQLTQYTVLDLIEKYLETLQRAGKLKASRENQLLRTGEAFRTVKLRELTPKHFVDFAIARSQAGVVPSTVMHDLGTLRSVFQAARPVLDIDIDDSAISSGIDAARRLGLASASDWRDRRPTDDELNRLFKEFARIEQLPLTEIPMTVLVSLAIAMPRRQDELCQMLWEDYTGDQVVLRDTKHPTKPRTEIIPVPPEARAIIDKLPRIDARILPYKAASVSSFFSRTCKRLGIEDLKFHDLRHHGISILFERGLEIQEVSLISGHLSWSSLKRYTQLRPQTVLTKLKRLAAEKAQAEKAEAA